MNFEATVDKKFITNTNGEEHAIICGEGLYINIYKNVDADQYCDQIFAEDIEILYAQSFGFSIQYLYNTNEITNN